MKGHVKDLEGVFEAYFPSLQRSSALAAIYSSFENELNRFCDLVQSAVSSGLRFQDLNGNGIERARNYLIKVGGFDLTAGENEWNAITKIREVRNCFVHADGVVKEGDKTITVNDRFAKRRWTAMSRIQPTNIAMQICAIAPILRGAQGHQQFQQVKPQNVAVPS